MADESNNIFGDLGTGVTSYVGDLAGSAIFWVAIVLAVLVLIVVGLKIKKNRRMKIRVFKIFELGNNKIDIDETWGGFFKKDRRLFGLWEFGGEDELITKDGCTVYGYEPSDLQEFNGKKVLMCTVNLDDPKMLFPVTSARLTDHARNLLLDIPPIEVREAAIDAHKKTIKEMKDFKEQIIQWIMIGLFFIVAFLTILFITQYGKHMVDAAAAQNEKTLATQVQLGQQLTDAVNKLVTKESSAP